MRKSSLSNLVSEGGDAQSNQEAATPSVGEEIDLLDVVADRIESYRNEERTLDILTNDQENTSTTKADDMTEQMIQGGKGQQQKELRSANLNTRSQPSRSEVTEDNIGAPRQTTCQSNQELSAPGAYALAPTPSDNNDAEIIIEETRHYIEPTPPEQDSSGLAVAKEVPDDLEDPRNLPQAEEFNENRESQKTQETNKLIALVLGYGICLVILIVLLVVLLWKRGDGTEPTLAMERVESNKEDGLMDYAMVPSASPVFERLLSYFPNYTIQALEVPGSPQSKALEWLLDDPDLMEYVDLEWRVKQRFALVALFYSTNGFNWTHSDSWLSYSHHECF
ncbi:Leucine Rich Repeat [Seminavis robusta]|uniref:Leucine Rich Repeat n=1 Tax=Seminavis robusta TaxID=568900 RepID=A0A9N8EAF9_9STRA|nr:Leucine Rich Repeat [Seminavis robusta]|eukprot:Sro840_g209450.1 Leucine Rich Repeat (336) ;mRNA; r:42213-43220